MLPKLALLASALFITLAYCIFFILDDETTVSLTREDGLVESASAFFFLLNYIVSKVVAQHIHTIGHNYLAEVKECGFAFLFVIVSLWFARDGHNRANKPQKRSE